MPPFASNGLNGSSQPKADALSAVLARRLLRQVRRKVQFCCTLRLCPICAGIGLFNAGVLTLSN